jgi:hypothetical protein
LVIQKHRPKCQALWQVDAKSRKEKHNLLVQWLVFKSRDYKLSTQVINIKPQ